MMFMKWIARQRAAVSVRGVCEMARVGPLLIGRWGLPVVRVPCHNSHAFFARRSAVWLDDFESCCR